jgi:hypothetical protein
MPEYLTDPIQTEDYRMFICAVVCTGCNNGWDLSLLESGNLERKGL